MDNKNKFIESADLKRYAPPAALAALLLFALACGADGETAANLIPQCPDSAIEPGETFEAITTLETGLQYLTTLITEEVWPKAGGWPAHQIAQVTDFIGSLWTGTQQTVRRLLEAGQEMSLTYAFDTFQLPETSPQALDIDPCEPKRLFNSQS